MKTICSHPIGYCTNVHPGATLEETKTQLDRHCVSVAKKLGRSGMGIGLWLNNTVAENLENLPEQRNRFIEFLQDRNLIPYTLNGFPYGNFHQPVVKQKVYSPDWTSKSRLHYTQSLAKILVELLETGSLEFGTISTLPIGWNRQKDHQYQQEAANHFLELVEFLSRLEDQSGKRIQVCIEPEPGCTLGDMKSTVEFFQNYLSPSDSVLYKRIRRYLSICYDTCHAAVMNESVSENLKLIGHAELEIGKVQVSSAPIASFDQADSPSKETIWNQLLTFSEPRYLHQTTVATGQGDIRFYEDLPLALEDESIQKKGKWSVHFHVPIYCQSIGLLETTTDHNRELIKQLESSSIRTHHWEVETYAWNVLPEIDQPSDLAEGIAEEVLYLEKLLEGTKWRK